MSMHRALWIRSCRDSTVMLSVSGLSMLADKSATLTCLGGLPVEEADIFRKQSCLEADLSGKPTCSRVCLWNLETGPMGL